MRLLQIHFDRALNFYLQITTLDRGGEIGLTGAGNGRGGGVVIQLERILQDYFKAPILTKSIDFSCGVTRRQGAPFHKLVKSHVRNCSEIARSVSENPGS